MAENTVILDLDRLRNLARRVDHAAEALRALAFRGVPPAALTGSDVGAVACPDRIAVRFADVITDLQNWATAARRGADTLGAAEAQAADGISRS